MGGIDGIEPCLVRLIPHRVWNASGTRWLRIGDKKTRASVTAEEARNFKTGVTEGAAIGSSLKREQSFWVYRGHGFSTPLDTEIDDVRTAFEHFRRSGSNIPADIR